ncbi:hypothetical protein QWY77_08310 [Thalassotalea ponticola]|uniref:hypothetical protein n=1 Tax=Thalassotalea ponticola TaxID=1523392 RepID=UPI0025B429B7|nr:hypothetical protein [Thalassotalea ponticola]MDN3652767.1 hypothetical protein [Thalassotalea ponticola]
MNNIASIDFTVNAVKNCLKKGLLNAGVINLNDHIAAYSEGIRMLVDDAMEGNTLTKTDAIKLADKLASKILTNQGF